MNKEQLISLIVEKDKYIGEFKNELKEGKGILYYSDEDIYKGEWKENRKEGNYLSKII